jgi:hypothetical protein
VTSFPFIVGSNRSGTTLLRSMFDSHPAMAIPPETYFVLRMARARRRYEASREFDTPRFISDLSRAGGFQRMGLRIDRVRNLLESKPGLDLPEAMRVLFREYAAEHGKARYGDKTPSYVSHIPFLAEVFPEACFIHIIRDGRDVSLSLLDNSADRLDEAAHFWRACVTAGRDAGRALGPGRYTEVRYEDLVLNPRERLTELCTFLGLDFDDRMLDYRDSAQKWMAATRDPNIHQSLLKPPTRQVRDWRTAMSRDEIFLFEALNGDLLDELGYERTLDRVTPRLWFDAVASKIQWQKRRAVRRAGQILSRT